MRGFLTILLFCCVFTAQAGTVDKIVLFGDSLSDNGNFYAASYHIIPKNPPYFNGRFSNGPTWIEYLAADMHVPLADYAYGGAVAKKDWNDLDGQVQTFLKEAGQDDVSNHLFVIWIGSNDYLEDGQDVEAVTSQTIQSIQKHVEMLIQRGARNVLLLSLPDLGQTPLARLVGKHYADKLTQMAKKHNTKLRVMIAQEINRHPEVAFRYYDVMSYFKDAVTHPEKFGLANTRAACFEDDTFMFKVLRAPAFDDLRTRLKNNGAIVRCGHPDGYLFWDHVHPTRVVHQKIAQKLYAYLQEQKNS